jgi:hypothetical protein
MVGAWGAVMQTVYSGVAKAPDISMSAIRLHRKVRRFLKDIAQKTPILRRRY